MFEVEHFDESEESRSPPLFKNSEGKPELLLSNKKKDNKITKQP